MNFIKYSNSKYVSAVLAFGLLMSSMHIKSFAGILSADTRYETFEGSNLIISDILEEDKVDIEIEGDTLVNLLGSQGKHVFSQDNINVRFRAFNEVNLKANTKYTLVVDITNVTGIKTSKLKVKYACVNDNGNFEEVYPFGHYSKEDIANGQMLVVFETDNRKPESVLNMYVDAIGGTGGGIESEFSFETSNCMLLEGDWANRELPGYFEGIQSGFENQLVTQEMVDLGEEKIENLGKYKVETKAIGKNILKSSQDISQSDSGWISYDNANITNEYYKGSKAYSTNGHAWSSYGYPIYNLVKNNLLDIESEYTFSCYVKSSSDSYSPRLRFYINSNITEASSTVVSNSIDTSWQRISITFKFTEKVFSIPDSSKYSKHYAIRVEPQEASLNGEYLLVSCLQLEKNDTATEYESYKESINRFYLNSPLLEGDTIEYINGQTTHIKRYKKIVLDGSESWSDWNTEVNIETVRFKIYTYDGRSNGVALSDKFRTRKAPSEKHSDTEYIGLVGSGSNLFINILLSKLPSADINGFKQWLSKNPVTVVYELDEPIYEPIKTDLSVNLFEGTTHISNNSNIPTIMGVTVDRVLNRAVEYTEIAENNPNIENISNARYWNNLIKESIIKEQLQGKVNNITQLEDLKLEKKYATSNLDVYIKSENMLSLSLDTNNVTFDNFSGVEDAEKLNAVNLIISSSLPYDINTYLVNEIQNSNKTNTMDRDILNIKESSEANYQVFNSVNDKIALKENCKSGNNNQHSIDLRLNGGIAHEKDVYKTTIKLEVEQK